MKLNEFEIGKSFIMSGKLWRCTDIGTRAVIAIKLDHEDDPSWYNGPPYAVMEYVIDEYDLDICYSTIEEYEENK